MRLLLATAALLAALAAPASASPGAPVAWQHKALTLAQHVWHPACGTLTLTFDASEPEAHGLAGWVDTLGDCHIQIRAQREWLGYPEFCDTVLHEAGHSAGVGHSDRGIMKPFRVIWKDRFVGAHGRVTVKWSGVDRRCLPAQRGTTSPRGV